ncbi:hypothetical protein Vadar_010376 [Vaccinium darrowii]|uniref:Uncharacterized protein n=1 Tax=Vaccinium darrowii TaxID=229202 RepID=A0ACB7XZP3_9ERIC|nr:hypothetical protein Vadar_010376 [Vaccinium darrowii]
MAEVLVFSYTTIGDWVQNLLISWAGVVLVSVGVVLVGALQYLVFRQVPIIVIWNPATRASSILPMSKLDLPPYKAMYCCHVGFGFDLKTKSIKAGDESITIWVMQKDFYRGVVAGEYFSLYSWSHELTVELPYSHPCLSTGFWSKNELQLWKTDWKLTVLTPVLYDIVTKQARDLGPEDRLWRSKDSNCSIHLLIENKSKLFGLGALPLPNDQHSGATKGDKGRRRRFEGDELGRDRRASPSERVEEEESFRAFNHYKSSAFSEWLKEKDREVEEDSDGAEKNDMEPINISKNDNKEAEVALPINTNDQLNNTTDSNFSSSGIGSSSSENERVLDTFEVDPNPIITPTCSMAQHFEKKLDNQGQGDDASIGKGINPTNVEATLDNPALIEPCCIHRNNAEENQVISSNDVLNEEGEHNLNEFVEMLVEAFEMALSDCEGSMQQGVTRYALWQQQGVVAAWQLYREASLIEEEGEDDEEMEVFMSSENRISDLPDYKDCLSPLEYCLLFEEDACENCYLWLMKEYGVSDSWSKQYNIVLEGRVQRLVGITRFDEIVYENQEDMVVLYNFESHQTKYSSTSFGNPYRFNVVPLIESLLFLEGEDGILDLESSFEGTSCEGTRSTSVKEEEESLKQTSVEEEEESLKQTSR